MLKITLTESCVFDLDDREKGKTMRPPFVPILIARTGHLQTIAGTYWPQPVQVTGQLSRYQVMTGNDGFLSVAANQPASWRGGQRIVLLIHGLTGSENSCHIVRLADTFVRRGFLTLRMNMRGCGPGEGLARGIYHSGRSEDARAVLEWIGRTFPGSPVTQIGISLGGNATLKMAGEYGDSAPDFLERVISVSAPIDLAASSRRLSRFQNIIFDRYFASAVVRHVMEQHQRFPDSIPPVPKALLSGTKTLARVDDLYVAPSAGFASGQDYYLKSSAAPLIGAIKPKTLIITAEDDPIADVTAYHNLKSPRHHDVLITKHGGHVAWVSRHKHVEHGRFWMDHVITDWVGPI